MKTKCRYCGVTRDVNIDASLKDVLYCGEICWRKDWERNGDGLRYPESSDVEMRSHPVLDIGE